MFNISMVGSYTYAQGELEAQLDGFFNRANTQDAAAPSNAASSMTPGESAFLDALDEVTEGEIQPSSSSSQASSLTNAAQASSPSDAELTPADLSSSDKYTGSLCSIAFLSSLSKEKAEKVIRAVQNNERMSNLNLGVKISLRRILTSPKANILNHAHDIVASIRQGIAQRKTHTWIVQALAAQGYKFSGDEIRALLSCLNRAEQS